MNQKSNYDISWICLQEVLIENGFFVSRSREAGGPSVPRDCKGQLVSQ